MHTYFGGVALICASLVFLIGQPDRPPGDIADRPADATFADAQESRQVVLITGSTSGLGRELAFRMARRGAHVIVHGRNEMRGAEVVRAIEAEGSGSARFIRADLASLEEVRQLAETVRNEYVRLDVLVNNAGIAATRSDAREESSDGHELMFAINYLSGFLLTHELLPLLEASAPARIVNVSSIGQRAIDFDDVMLESDYSSGRAYTQSKLAQILFTIDLAEELEGTGVTVNAVHPATFMDTNMVQELGVQPRSTVDEGAESVMNLIVGSDLGSGGYFNQLEPGRAVDQAYDPDARRQLRELSERLVENFRTGEYEKPEYSNTREMLRALEDRYPQDLLNRGIGGTTRIRYTIDASGRVLGVEVAESSGRPAFDDAALEVARIAEFEPARRNGDRVAATVVYPIVFRAGGR